MTKRKYRKQIPIHQYLVAWREFSDYTQEEVAKKMKVTPGAVSRWESGDRGIHINNLHSYAEAIGREPRELLRTSSTIQAQTQQGMIMFTQTRERALEATRLSSKGITTQEDRTAIAEHLRTILRLLAEWELLAKVVADNDHRHLPSFDLQEIIQLMMDRADDYEGMEE